MLSDYLSYFLVPRAFYRHRLNAVLDSLNGAERRLVGERTEYYNKLSAPVPLSGGVTVGHYRFPFKKKDFGDKKSRLSTYFFDQYEVMRYFPSADRFRYIHGDVTHTPAEPTFVKSRPITGDNANAVILKLNKRRHFRFVDDPTPFADKKDMLVWRANWCNAKPWRRQFCEMFVNDSMCDVGKVKPEPDEDFPESVKGFVPIERQLGYKFIACIEGNDVATSLKWVMSSNSVAVSPPMRYETWFMEGRLRPDYHYIEVAPDYSDLKDKLKYYISHPAEAEAIIAHAHEWVGQFRDSRTELATQLNVARKYFDLTNS